MRLVMALSCAVVLSACATQRQYQWGDYEQSLYEGYKDSSKMEALMQSRGQSICRPVRKTRRLRCMGVNGICGRKARGS